MARMDGWPFVAAALEGVEACAVRKVWSVWTESTECVGSACTELSGGVGDVMLRGMGSGVAFGSCIGLTVRTEDKVGMRV